MNTGAMKVKKVLRRELLLLTNIAGIIFFKCAEVINSIRIIYYGHSDQLKIP